MKFNMYHVSLGVLNLEKSMRFYEEALGLSEKRRVEEEDGSFILVFMGGDDFASQVELTWYRDKKEPFNLGDNEVHLGVYVDEYEKAHQKHREMGCICFENEKMGLYFIADPDGYWIEIVPANKAGLQA